MAGPLIVLSIPFWTSTTPPILLIASPIRGPSSASSAGSFAKTLIWIGSGAFDRSPIMSCSTCVNSTSSSGSVFLISARASAMTSSMPRSRLLFSFTVMSPVFASVTAASPI